MVKYDPAYVIAISDFALSWRITDSRWSVLPPQLLSRIHPLSPAKAQTISDRLPLFERYPYPFNPADYHATREISLKTEGDEDAKRIKQCLLDLPVKATEDHYVCWRADEGTAVVTDWYTFVEVWHDLWYPLDIVAVFDESVDWAVILGPEEWAVFVERGAVDPQLPETHPAYGLVLLQTDPQ